MQWICFRRSKLKWMAGRPSTRAAALLLVCALAAVGATILRSQGALSPQATSAQKAGAAQPAGSATAQPDDAAVDEEPSPSNFTGATYVPSGPAILDGPAARPLMAAAPPPKPIPADAGGDTVRQQINNDTADLLTLAYALKAEMDKSTQNTLSVGVVRKASQIELLARKVQGELHPTTTSRN